MSMLVEKPVERFTIEEYLRREEAAEERHEFHDGEILAMSGGTFRHALISTNLVVHLANRLAGSPCVPVNSDLRVSVAAARRYMYPDASIICDPPEFDLSDKTQGTILNPRVIFEVLSESTEAYDRGDKFQQYRRVSSFEEYHLISQSERLVESFLRQPDGTWSLMTWQGLGAVARVRCLSIEVPFDTLYARIEFPPEPGV